MESGDFTKCKKSILNTANKCHYCGANQTKPAEVIVALRLIILILLGFVGIKTWLARCMGRDPSALSLLAKKTRENIGSDKIFRTKLDQLKLTIQSNN